MKSMVMCAALHTGIATDSSAGVRRAGSPFIAERAVNVITHPVFHIVEEPGGIEHMTDCECPTEAYYEALALDMKKRHPKAVPFVLEHASSLEPFLDTSILAGFSFGINKALIGMTTGKLLGHTVGRFGACCDGKRTQAINDFAPLMDQSHVRQFVGSTNWVRWYLPFTYPVVVKILGEYMKPGAVFPACGLGAEGDVNACTGSKAVRAIKAMARNAIETSCMDEAGAIDGSRPLEQIADACGYAWSSTSLQMTEDLLRFKVLLMVGKGFTPAQQAWPALIIEAHAQLMGKRMQRNGPYEDPKLDRSC